MKAAATPASELYCSACERMYPTSTGDVCPRDGTRLVRLVGQKDPYAGRDLDGRYQILEKLGQGGMGAVYRGNQRSVDRQVAIKVVNAHAMSDPEMIKRFLREARLASRINHPNAVAVLDFGQTSDGVFYLVMELVAGKTLGEILDEELKLDAERSAEIGAQICQALEGAHAVPIVHRDLKPANVIVDPNGFVKVLDFGIAKSLSPDTISSTMTHAGAVMGTPAFMPPEVGLGNPCDERSDLYSLGCLLYVMVSGDVPFDADALPALMMKHAAEPPPPLVGVPRDLEAVIMKLLEKNPRSRYQTATEARLALLSTIHGTRAVPKPWAANTLLGGRGAAVHVGAPTVPLDAAAARGRSRAQRPVWPWLAGAGALAALAIVWFALDPLGGSAIKTGSSDPVIAPAAVDDPTPTPVVVEPIVVEPTVVPAAVEPSVVAPTDAPVDEITMTPDPVARPKKPTKPTKPTVKPIKPVNELPEKPAKPVKPPEGDPPPPF